MTPEIAILEKNTLTALGLRTILEELIPEANLDAHSHAGTYGVMIGFLIMMIMDVALG